MPRPTRVALALGSGGARGYAHIGVIEVLEEQGYEIVGIAGSSMGAVVGGLFAAGRLDAYVEWVRPLTQRDVLRLLDPSWRGPGAIRGGKVLAKVSELLGDILIEDLPVDFTAVTTDLVAGREVWFQQGRVDAAIRASMALPSFFTPVVLDGRLLADGGLLDPVPVAATMATPADLVVAVALSEEHVSSTAAGPVQELARPDGPEQDADSDQADRRLRDSVAAMLDRELVRTVANWVGGGRDLPRPDAEEEEGDSAPFGALPSGMGTLDIVQLSLDAVQAAIARYRLAGYPPDVLVTIPKTACRTLEFHRAEEMIALGRERTLRALEGRVEAG